MTRGSLRWRPKRHDPPTGTISLYYGAGDSLIARETVNLEEILAYLRTVPRG